VFLKTTFAKSHTIPQTKSNAVIEGAIIVLRAMLNPKSVALIGATEATSSAGRTLMENLRSFWGAFSQSI
jgi:hypothetical protein